MADWRARRAYEMARSGKLGTDARPNPALMHTPPWTDAQKTGSYARAKTMADGPMIPNSEYMAW